ncbi:XkdX family protein [Enterococcus faecalis]
MNKFPGFTAIKQCYDWGCYTKQDLVDYVTMNALTKEQYQTICGEVYPS